MDTEDIGVDLEDEYQPPTEAEMKVIKARRERQNQISKLIGEHLLKGITMLSTTCPVCDTILLRTKQGVEFCVACTELDSDSTKDNPALSSEAAMSKVLEQDVALAPRPSPQVFSAGGSALLSQRHTTQVRTRDKYSSSTAQPANGLPMHTDHPGEGAARPVELMQTEDGSAVSTRRVLSPNETGLVASVSQYHRVGRGSTKCRAMLKAEALKAVEDKLRWATEQLEKADRSDSVVQMCQVMQTCANTIHSLDALS